MFQCKNCRTHAQELREMRMSHESEKQQMRKDFSEQMTKKDVMISELHDRLMSRDLYELETAKNPPKQPDVTPEEDPYVDLQDVPGIIPKSEIESTLNNG